MENLLIDIGNSSLKASFSSSLKLEKIYYYQGEEILQFIIGLAQLREIEIVAISSVKKIENNYFLPLESYCKRVLIIDQKSKLPIGNLYNTPESLGSDRLAAAVGGAALFPGRDLIIFDFGTALTIDFVSKEATFQGGNISLGLSTRVKALNHFTQRVPLIEKPLESTNIGVNTEGAIEAGVLLGLIFEIEGYIERYPNRIYIFTGRDAIYFAEKVKSSIFVICNLVLTGLAHIAEEYVERENI